MSLLQFTTLGTVSHLYAKKIQTVNDNVLNMAISALEMKNVNVRLAAARALFNACLQLKYIKLVGKEQSSNNYGKQLDKIVKAVTSKLNTETHTPTRYRELAILGLVLYCDDELIKWNEGIQLEIEKWKLKEHSTTTNLLTDVAKLFNKTK